LLSPLGYLCSVGFLSKTKVLGERVIAIPGYVDRETWEAFVEMRKAIKKPLTTFAAKLVVYELQRIKDAGHDANAALRQSILNCWKDVFVPKEKTIEHKRAKEAEETAAFLDKQRLTPEQRAASEDARKRAMAGRRIH
jgi:hypothetical protein